MALTFNRRLFAAHICTFRVVDSHLTYKEMALKFGVNTDLLIAFENTIEAPTTDELKYICSVMNVHPDDYYSDPEENKRTDFHMKTLKLKQKKSHSGHWMVYVFILMIINHTYFGLWVLRDLFINLWNLITNLIT